MIVVTESNMYKTDLKGSNLNFNKIELKRNDSVKSVMLIDFFFHLHDGRIWGLPGKLLFDAVGIVIFFLSLSAFYTWYFPKMMKRKREKRLSLNRTAKKVYKFFFKYHLKLGIWAAGITIIIAGTGFFMRPPMLVAIAEGSLNANYYPGALPENPWQEKIQNALYDPAEKKVVITTTEGIFSGNADFSAPFVKDSLNAPIFVMGATVFENYDSNGYLIGSFSGLFQLDKDKGYSVDVLTGKEAENKSNIRPADIMVVGYFKTPDGEEFITSHAKGLQPVGNGEIKGRFNMPEELKSDLKMPLWNYLFEMHNGRLFRSVLGDYYILLVPMGALLFLIITVTGIYDWFILRTKRIGRMQ
jgi:hypothetical protein